MLDSPAQHRRIAKERLASANKPGFVILFHTGVAVLLSLILTLADHFLDQQIATTGGLGGVGTRAILTTVQYVLRLMPLVLLPFWQAGYTHYTLLIARGQAAGRNDLLEGFRRLGPVLRLNLCTVGFVIALTMFSSYVGSFLFMLTPWSIPLMEEMEALMAASPEMTDVEFANALFAAMDNSILPVMILFGLCFLIGGAVLFYRFRLAEFWLMDHPDSGALAALWGSRKLSKGSWKGLLKIDLGFWWFFLLEILVSVLGMGDVILDAFGISMSSDAFVSYLIFFCLYLWAQLMLYWWKKNHISVTYAHAYLALCPEETETKV